MGNLIIANVYLRPTDFFNIRWEMTTLKFKIIDSDSIKLFENILHWSANTEFRTLNEAKTYHFVKIDENPRIDPAIYKQKWLWEHEEDWQRWMDAQAIRQQSNKVNRKDGKLLNKLFGTTSFLDILNNTAFDFIGKRVKIERPETQNDSITLEEYMKSLADYKEIHGNISEQVRGSLHINSIDEKNRSGGYDAVITVVP